MSKALKAARVGHFDGITFDYESVIAAVDTKTMDLYSELIRQTTAAFHQAIHGSQVSRDRPHIPREEVKWLKPPVRVTFPESP